jgi:hypothetical protein
MKNSIPKVIQTSIEVTNILKTTTNHSEEAIILASLAKATEELGEVSQAILRTLNFKNASKSAEGTAWEASQECIDAIICLVDLFTHMANLGQIPLESETIDQMIQTSLYVKLPKWRAKYDLEPLCNLPDDLRSL